MFLRSVALSLLSKVSSMALLNIMALVIFKRFNFSTFKFDKIKESDSFLRRVLIQIRGGKRIHTHMSCLEHRNTPR